MKSFGMEIEISRGESFSIDYSVTDKKKVPYIVLAALQNPYIAISVVNSPYTNEDRYVKTWWLDLKNGYVDTITGLQPIKIQRFASVEPVDVVDNTGITDPNYVYHNTTDDKYYYLPANLYANYNTFTTTSDYIGYYVYYNSILTLINSDNKDGLDITPGTTQAYTLGTVAEYIFRIVKTFTAAETEKWLDFNYTYSIKLVAGVTVVETLQGLVIQNDLLPDGQTMPTTVQQLLPLFEGHEELLEGVALDGRPLQFYDVRQDILLPTKIKVNTDDTVRGY